MGAPKRNRRKFERPAAIWDKARIDSEHKLCDTYGLTKLTELWRASSEVRRVRRNVREVLSGKAAEQVGKDMVARLARYGVVKEDTVLDDLLLIKAEVLLERRLQTLVFRKGMAKSIKQARQLITHGFIAVNGRRSTSPGYLVTTVDESSISYYKPINLDVQVAPQVQAVVAGSEKAAEAKTEQDKKSE